MNESALIVCAFVVGTMFGAVSGILTLAICVAAKRADACAGSES